MVERSPDGPDADATAREGGSGVRVEVVFDYVDPGSYLVTRLLERWGSGPGGRAASIRWRPLELRPPGSAPIDRRAPEWAAMEEAMAEEAGELGVAFRPPPGGLPRSRKAHELALHAREAGRFDAVHRGLFAARFEAGLDLGRVDVLVEVARGAGMDSAEARTVLGVDRFRPAVEAERDRLLDEGIRGVPTVRIAGGRILVEGYPGWGALLDVMNSLDDGGEGRWQVT